MHAAGVRQGARIRAAVGRLGATLAFGGGIAAIVILIGTQDLESYEHAFFSLDRGTAAEAIQVLGQPVYTLAVGLGVRLPLHGSLGASPAAAAARYVPAPFTYWLLLTLAIGAAALVVRHALEPLCGRVIPWLALVLLFCSAPMVNYTISDDWPETAATYCAFVGCVFAPHALLTLLNNAASHARRVAGLSLGAVLWSLVALSHPGYWPLIAGSLALASTLTLCRTDHPFRRRLTAVAALAVVALMAVAPQLPDIARELRAASDAGEVKRFVQGPEGSLLSANAFPFGETGARLPFTYLALALVALAIALRSTDAPRRGLIIGGALISIALGLGAATLPPGLWAFSPSATWALRDPAVAFAVLSAACAAGTLRGVPRGNRAIRRGPAVAALVLAGLQGPALAAHLVARTMPQSSDRPWTQDVTAPAQRLADRGLARNRVSPGERVALWQGVHGAMRTARRASTDIADAGYLLATAWTKQRTMRGLVEEPNTYLFDQATELSVEILCDERAVSFLQLRYLLRPSDVAACGPWSRMPGLVVDGGLEVDAVTHVDRRVRALPAARLADPMNRGAALAPGSELVSALASVPGSQLTIASPEIAIRLEDPSSIEGKALVLPVAYDSAWRASSGHVASARGLLALADVNQRHVTLVFVPDAAAVLRALAMTLAQLLAVGGLLGLGYAPLRDE